MKAVVIFCIRLYQLVFSPGRGLVGVFLPQSCRFLPTCSDYTIEAIDHYGLGKGLFVGFKRIVRCHPWHKGGIDTLVSDGSKSLL